jgi:MoaA/NifB/PqqE/SkfB family radical SAM enzyme
MKQEESTLREYNDNDKEFIDLSNKVQELKDEAEYFVNNPEELREQCNNDLIKDKEEVYKNRKLDVPKADSYAQRMVYYKGFLKYKDRLENYVISTNPSFSLNRPYMPTIMDIEPNSRCNFRCKMCHVSSWEKGKRAEDMSYEQLKDFIDNNNYLTEVKLHGMGEPFLHRNYIDMIQHLDKKSIWSRTTTNGSLLHKRDNCIKLIDANIGEVQCSVDGATKEVFETIREKSNFERVFDNFKMLNEYANTKDRPYTRMWVVLQKDNIHQLFDFVYIAKEMGFKRLAFNSTLNDWGRDEWDVRNSKIRISNLSKEDHDKLITLSQELDIDVTLWEQTGIYSTDKKENLCPWIFSRPYITSDYKIVPCCMIADPRVINFGDADNFQKEWNSFKYQEFRKSHLDGNIPSMCKNCYSC